MIARTISFLTNIDSQSESPLPKRVRRFKAAKRTVKGVILREHCKILAGPFGQLMT